jgi:hypothetical protein
LRRLHRRQAALPLFTSFCKSYVVFLRITQHKISIKRNFVVYRFVTGNIAQQYFSASLS